MKMRYFKQTKKKVSVNYTSSRTGLMHYDQSTYHHGMISPIFKLTLDTKFLAIQLD